MICFRNDDEKDIAAFPQIRYNQNFYYRFHWQMVKLKINKEV